MSVQPNSLPITLITLIPHTRWKAGMVLVVISMIMIVLSSLLYFAAQEVLKRKCVERTLGNVTLINFVAGGVSEHWAAICVSSKHTVEKQKEVYICVCVCLLWNKRPTSTFQHSLLSLTIITPPSESIVFRGWDNFSLKSQPWSNPTLTGATQKVSNPTSLNIHFQLLSVLRKMIIWGESWRQ